MVDMTCFARRQFSLPIGKRLFDEKASSLFGECAVLECDCPGALECPFYKTKAQLEDEKERAFELADGWPRGDIAMFKNCEGYPDPTAGRPTAKSSSASG